MQLPLRFFPGRSKTLKKVTLGHLSNLFYTICGHVDESSWYRVPKVGVPPKNNSGAAIAAATQKTLLLLYVRFLTGICLLLSIILFQRLLEHVLLHNDPVEGNNSLHGCFPSGIFEQDSVNVTTYSSTTCSTVDCNAIPPLYNTNNENIDPESDHQVLTSDTSCSDKSSVLSYTLALRDNVIRK